MARVLIIRPDEARRREDTGPKYPTAERWVVDTRAMTCTYLDKAGNKVLVEEIPVR